MELHLLRHQEASVVHRPEERNQPMNRVSCSTRLALTAVALLSLTLPVVAQDVTKDRETFKPLLFPALPRPSPSRSAAREKRPFWGRSPGSPFTSTPWMRRRRCLGSPRRSAPSPQPMATPS